MTTEWKPDLSDLEYYVTQQNGTERAFTGKYWDFDEPGIYVDPVDGTPLFASADKFPSSCGWPAFSKPIEGATKYLADHSHGMERIEVRSSKADSHLGHVFNDGPKELGGLRYCINSAALRFIPLADLEKMGYGKYIPLVDEEVDKLKASRAH